MQRKKNHVRGTLMIICFVSTGDEVMLSTKLLYVLDELLFFQNELSIEIVVKIGISRYIKNIYKHVCPLFGYIKYNNSIN